MTGRSAQSGKRARYPAYKASGIEWLGEIPGEWKVKKLRHLGRCQNGINIGAEFFGVGYPFVSYGDVYNNEELPYKVDGLVQSSVLDRDRYSVKAGDVFFTRTSETIEEIGISSTCLNSIDDAVFAGFLIRFRPLGNKLSAEFSKYYFQNYLLRAFFVKEMNIVTRASLSQDLLKQMPVLLPPFDQQIQIAAFLNYETARIDALIKKKQRQIELLQEKRSALISHAVTKGLDPNAKMKDSGIEWIGEIPERWSLLQLRRVVDKFVDYRGRTPTKTESGVPLITAGAVKDGKIDHSTVPEYIAEEEYDDWMVRGKPERGDIVITTEAPLGEVGQVCDTNVAFAQRIILFKVNAIIMMPEFLRYYYLSVSGRSELLSRASGSTASGIRADRLKMSTVIVPPLGEQRAIVEYLEESLKPLLTPRSLISESIGKLRELRTALISAAVTGKIDVRREVAV